MAKACLKTLRFDEGRQKSLWQEVVEENIFVVCMTPMAKAITKRTLLGFENGNYNAEYIDNLVPKMKEDCGKVAKDILRKSFWHLGDGTMDFDAVVGNPPYMTMDGGANGSAQPVYQRFVYVATDVTRFACSLVVPARWYSGGREHELRNFREFMLHSEHLALLHDFADPESVFPHTNIRSGICYFLWDNSYDSNSNLTRVVCHRANGEVVEAQRPMAIDDLSVFVRNWEAVSILEKTKGDYSKDNIGNHFSTARPFGFRGYFRHDRRFKPTNEDLADPIVCVAKGYTKGFVEREYVTVHREWIDVWKVFTPRANNIGTELPDDNFNVCVAQPGIICTESYQVIGMDLGLDLESASNLATYLQTRFARMLHSLSKASQDVSAKTLSFVPLQDFTAGSDIDWTKSIHEIDQQLFLKYGLTDAEIKYIEGTIKPMDYSLPNQFAGG